MAKKQIRKTLSRRSVSRVANELKVLFDRYSNKQIYNKLQYISKHFDYIASYCGDIKAKINKVIKDSNFRPSFSSTIESKLRDIGYKKETINDYINEIACSAKSLVKVEDLKAALIYLLDNYDYVAYQDNKLTVQTDDIFVPYDDKQIGFGPFDIILDLDSNDDCIEYRFVCKALKPRTRCDHHDHPNLSESSRLCCGDGARALIKCLNEGRIGDFIDIVQQILRTHSNSPYVSIGEWL